MERMVHELLVRFHLLPPEDGDGHEHHLRELEERLRVAQTRARAQRELDELERRARERREGRD